MNVVLQQAKVLYFEDDLSGLYYSEDEAKAVSLFYEIDERVRQRFVLPAIEDLYWSPTRDRHWRSVSPTAIEAPWQIHALLSWIIDTESLRTVIRQAGTADLPRVGILLDLHDRAGSTDVRGSPRTYSLDAPPPLKMKWHWRLYYWLFRPSGESAQAFSDDWKQVIAEILERDGHRCANCGSQDLELVVRHVVPPRYGGTSRSTNLVTLCSDCELLTLASRSR